MIFCILYSIFCAASRWEQEERQSERESKITEQDTAASHYNDLVRNMVSMIKCPFIL